MQKGRPNADFRYYEPPKEAWKTATDRFFAKDNTPNFYPQHRNTNITIKEGKHNPAAKGLGKNYSSQYLKCQKMEFRRTNDHRADTVLTVV